MSIRAFLGHNADRMTEQEIPLFDSPAVWVGVPGDLGFPDEGGGAPPSKPSSMPKPAEGSGDVPLATDKATILVVDDDEGVRGVFEDVLTDAGYAVIVAEHGTQALKLLRTHRVDAVVTDLVMPEREGIELITILRKEHPDLRIIAVSGAFGGRFLPIAGSLGADITLPKPVSSLQLTAAVRGLLEKPAPGDSGTSR
jgi:CheY-like chemotaxis protein